MNKQEAIDVVRQVYEGFKGTLQEHRTVQEAIKTLETLVEPKAKVEPKAAKA